METGSYWFKFLSETEQKEFRENVKGDWEFLMEHEEENFAGFIACAFIWEYTPQGHDYWREISERKVI
jgi:hypothetical protein